MGCFVAKPVKIITIKNNPDNNLNQNNNYNFIQNKNNPSPKNYSHNKNKINNHTKYIEDVKKIEIKSLYHKRKNYLYVISPHNWLNIIDFLDFKELKETGKINRTFNYLVKKSKILVKFFINKKHMKKIKENNNNNYNNNNNRSIVSSNSFLNINIFGDNTVVSLPSFAQKDASSFNSGHVPNSSNSQQSLNQGQNTNTFKNFTLKNNGRLTINNNNINSSVCVYKNSHPGFYYDFFTENQIDWNIIRKDMMNLDSKFMTTCSNDPTPSFSSTLTKFSDTHHQDINKYNNKNKNKCSFSGTIKTNINNNLTTKNESSKFVNSSTLVNAPTKTILNHSNTEENKSFNQNKNVKFNYVKINRNENKIFNKIGSNNLSLFEVIEEENKKVVKL